MINDKDQTLLEILQKNARISISELARTLGISRTTAQHRLERLEHSGIIEGYRVNLGSTYLKALVAAHVSIKVKQKLTMETCEQLHKLSAVHALHAISGEFDLIAELQAASLEQLNGILDEIGDLPGVERTASSVILETKFRR
ncbi:Lrp/AsnC family transcriptional regulator [Bermanella marisrubri]|uniref:Putative transcriptional regulator, AsnC family protein n=1 Tax=Bermanella marisrubri TaxID=207949 RepID=Q1MZU7_9GAMM|nr:Lrp/AsnC family transcriptional regulator [Bermanella marisrubri]EAT11460.1 putative transcriptional regulator, AsnC family protein [Oceanobacter sp. RED65] [Bermanella marisrubri]QIZ85038.1 Lrp/AsnC family transcriptional regulator [Bermanella marisrubri]